MSHKEAATAAVVAIDINMDISNMTYADLNATLQNIESTGYVFTPADIKTVKHLRRRIGTKFNGKITRDKHKTAAESRVVFLENLLKEARTDLNDMKKRLEIQQVLHRDMGGRLLRMEQDNAMAVHLLRQSIHASINLDQYTGEPPVPYEKEEETASF